MIDFYEILAVPPIASEAEIKAAYRRLAAKSHPDVGGSAGLFRLIQEAYETLSDVGRRRTYDMSVAASGSGIRSAGDKALDELVKARTTFLYLAERFNSAIDSAWASYGDSEPAWENLPSIYALCAAADKEFAQAVAAYTWPTLARQAASALVAATALEAGKEFQCSVLPGTQAALSGPLAELSRAEAKSSAAVSVMRTALGLSDNR